MRPKEAFTGGVKNKAAQQNAAAAKKIRVENRDSMWSDNLGEDHFAKDDDATDIVED